MHSLGVHNGLGSFAAAAQESIQPGPCRALRARYQGQQGSTLPPVDLRAVCFVRAMAASVQRSERCWLCRTGNAVCPKHNQEFEASWALCWACFRFSSPPV